MNNKNTIGILGGMGPFATLFFLEKLMKNTPAKKDWDHFRVIVDNNPHIPSRSRAILYGEQTPVDGMIQSCKSLENYPVDVIAIPCNSACYYIDEIRPSVKVPILDIREITSVSLQSHKIPQKSSVLVLGGAVTYLEETYKKFLDQANYSYVQHSSADQTEVEVFIELVKLNNVGPVTNDSFQMFLNKVVKKYNANAIIFGCTELSYFVNKSQKEYSIIDSTTELAEYIIANYRKMD